MSSNSYTMKAFMLFRRTDIQKFVPCDMDHPFKWPSSSQCEDSGIPWTLRGRHALRGVAPEVAPHAIQAAFLVRTPTGFSHWLIPPGISIGVRAGCVSDGGA